MAIVRLYGNSSVVLDNGKFYCDHKKLQALCGKCAVWLLEEKIARESELKSP